MGVATAEEEPPKVSMKWGVPNRFCTRQLQIITRSKCHKGSISLSEEGVSGGKEQPDTEERLRHLRAEIPDREWEVEIRRSDLFGERKREPGLPRG